MSLVNSHSLYYTLSFNKSEIGHLRDTLDFPRELDGPLLSKLEGGREQLLTDGNGIGLYFCIRVNLGASHCADCWSHYCLAINTYHRLFLLCI